MTRAEVSRAARDEDTALIAGLRRQLAAVTADRDELLGAIASITAALALPEGAELHKIIGRIQEVM